MSRTLSVQRVHKSFRGLRALADITFTVESGSITALVGPNGAGKTTLFNLIAATLAPDFGEIRLDGRRIDGLRPDQVCALGIGRTFQIAKPFTGLTVLDNVVVGALQRSASVKEARAHAEPMLEALGLLAKRDLPAAMLTLPDRKRLEVARALATRPRLLLLDEAMAGLRPAECERMIDLLRQINRRDGTTILLIEHVMSAVMALAQKIIALNSGAIIAEGSPAEIVRDPAVLESYLGEQAEL
jgi:branched-chain amino acid transport system ATP-binding protein